MTARSAFFKRSIAHCAPLRYIRDGRTSTSKSGREKGGSTNHMTLKSKRRLAICLAAIVGLCLSPSNRLKCQAFVTSTPATGRGSTGTTSAHPVSRGCASTRTRSTIRSRDSTTSRLYSAVEDVERSTVVGDKGWTSSSSSSREVRCELR